MTMKKTVAVTLVLMLATSQVLWARPADGGATPEELVEQVIARLAPDEGVVEVSITSEDEYFPPPRELRELLGAMEAAVNAAVAVPQSVREEHRDREVAASNVLADLAR